MATRTCLEVTLYVHCLSCLNCLAHRKTESKICCGRKTCFYASSTRVLETFFSSDKYRVTVKEIDTFNVVLKINY